MMILYVKVPVHEMSPHAVPVLDSHGAFGAPACAVSVLHAHVGNFFLLFFFDGSFCRLPALCFLAAICAVSSCLEWMYRMWSGKLLLSCIVASRIGHVT
jgi:hypothetical protein